MASKKKNRRKGPPASAPVVQQREGKPKVKHGQPMRETVEALVIAFVLAFLFRTFQAEMFVIPTGSMAPTLMGRHQDFDCTACGQRYRIGDSFPKPQQVQAAVDDARRRGERLTAAQVIELNSTVAGTCPTCRHTMLTKPLQGAPNTKTVKKQRGYSGDRIIVNKLIYSFQDPQRWDVVVFKYPGNAVENYIKRLVGLPGEQLRIEHGDVFVRTSDDQPYEILRKPADKLLAVRQLVHDTDHDPASLRKMNYPLRWSTEAEDSAWKVQETIAGPLVQQQYHLQADEDQTHWLRYRHVPPSFATWGKVGTTTPSGDPVPLTVTPRLVADDNAYNSGVSMQQALRQQSIATPPSSRGLHWVGDLMVDVEIEVESSDGQLLLELVEAGCRFQASWQIDSGTVQVTAVKPDGSLATDVLNAQADTSLKGPGSYHVRMANVDDQILLWVNDKVVELSATYDPTQLVGSRQDMIPRASETDPGDLSPVAIGGNQLAATVSRLAVYRDIYYIADKNPPDRDDPRQRTYGAPVSDYALVPFGGRWQVRGAAGMTSLQDMLTKPETWAAYRSRNTAEFSLQSKNQEQLLFVMGDNSGASLDARLWADGNGGMPGKPGGHYLERSLLIGKAVCVYWPHSFDRLQGTNLPLPFFPNFGDMRRVR